MTTAATLVGQVRPKYFRWWVVSRVCSGYVCSHTDISSNPNFRPIGGQTMTITADTEAGVDVCQRVVEAVELLTIVDVEGADRDGLDVVVAARHTVAAFLDMVDVRVVR